MLSDLIKYLSTILYDAYMQTLCIARPIYENFTFLSSVIFIFLILYNSDNRYIKNWLIR